MRKLLLTIVLVLFAAPALATDDIWTTTPGGSGPCTLARNGVCFYRTDAGGGTRRTLPQQNLGSCREVSVSIVADEDDETLFANLIDVYEWHSTSSARPTDDLKTTHIGSTSLNGDFSASREALYGFDVGYQMYLKFTDTSGGKMLARASCYK